MFNQGADPERLAPKTIAAGAPVRAPEYALIPLEVVVLPRMLDPFTYRCFCVRRHDITASIADSQAGQALSARWITTRATNTPVTAWAD